MEYGALALLIFLAAVVTWGAFRARARYLNQKAAWEWREWIAQIAHVIESNEYAPPNVRSFIDFIAKKAFDEQFLCEFIRSREMKYEEERDEKAFARLMREEFGDEYGQDLIWAAQSLVLVGLCVDPKEGPAMRKAARQLDKKRALAERAEKEGNQFVPDVLQYFKSDPSNSVAPAY